MSYQINVREHGKVLKSQSSQKKAILPYFVTLTPNKRETFYKHHDKGVIYDGKTEIRVNGLIIVDVLELCGYDIGKSVGGWRQIKCRFIQGVKRRMSLILRGGKAPNAEQIRRYPRTERYAPATRTFVSLCQKLLDTGSVQCRRRHNDGPVRPPRVLNMEQQILNRVEKDPNVSKCMVYSTEVFNESDSIHVIVYLAFDKAFLFQYVTEKMGGAEGTKLDLDFMDMERKTDVTYELVEELQVKTKEFLQPNPTARAKMAAVKSISKLSGQAKSNTYPQPDGDDSLFGLALVEMGESLKQMADVKYSLDDNIKQNFLEPLHHLQTKDLKEVMHHRKKLQGRRLDFDCKRRRQAKASKGVLSPYNSPVKTQGGHGSNIADDEIKMAEEKFAESLHLAQMGMFNLLENDVEQISQLATFAEGLLEYHTQCTEVLKLLTVTLLEKKDEAANRPKLEFVPKSLTELNIEGITDGLNGTNNHNNLLNHHGSHYSSNSNLSSGYQFKRPAPRTISNKQPTYKPDPFDPWSFPSGSPQASSPQHKPYQLELHPGQQSANASPLPSPMKSPARTPMTRQPCCTALYDFEPENPGELGFKENDVIFLLNKIDENWFEGSVNGRTGYFPVNYVKVDVPLP
ncbi:hypothetical protein NQ317_009920 [Molorchus minor]|uniref:Endophilin-A n=1 Tax=Molorchus minor TaxID=1323400 RepID=A0ABQ9K8L9_9CUCU|nr:hypothetical protein NQ317_009920 [Molorchus minor]